MGSNKVNDYSKEYRQRQRSATERTTSHDWQRIDHSRRPSYDYYHRGSYDPIDSMNNAHRRRSQSFKASDFLMSPKSLRGWSVNGGRSVSERRHRERERKGSTSYPMRVSIRTPSPRESRPPEFRLVYFDRRGRAEAIRQLFVVVGVPFRDERITESGWRKMKNHTPFQQLPVLDVGGRFQLGQTHAILRYLARRFNLCGETEEDEAIIDSLSERYSDYYDDILPWMSVAEGYTKGDERHLRERILYPASVRFFSCLEMFLKQGNGFLARSGLSYVDLVVAEGLSQIMEYESRMIEEHKRIDEYVKKIRRIPRIRDWLTRRPRSQG